MVRADIKRADAIERRETVPAHDRTTARDEAAAWIETHVLSNSKPWPEWTISEIADRSGWSREHISNTLDAYFRPEGADDRPDVLRDLEAAAGAPETEGDYEAGFQAGFMKGVEFALERQAELEELIDS